LATGKSCDKKSIPPDSTSVSKLRRNIVSWYVRNGRVYPWREEPGKYNLVIAELMLRRTKADQVEPVFNKFVARYPDPATLARARQASVIKLTKPLGLDWRNDTFVPMAKKAVTDFDGDIPETRDQIKQLPGVGDYVAGAVLSIALNKPEWIVDSNIARFFVRYFGVQTGKEARRNPVIIEIARRYARCKNPRRANLALIDYSSLVCSPSTPLCDECCLQDCLSGGER
jgi:A/G-specific adenine glycosylase